MPPHTRLVVAEVAAATLMVGSEVIAVSELPEAVAIDPAGTRIATAVALSAAHEVALVDLDDGVLAIFRVARAVV